LFCFLENRLTHVQLTGDAAAPPLVLLHSLGTSSHVWDMQARHFAASHFVIQPDFRGHGLSGIDDEPLTVERLAEDVLAILDSLSVASFSLAGISIGGLVAQAIAARVVDRVRTLALFDSTLWSPLPDLWLNRAAKIRAQGLEAVVDEVFARWLPPDALGTPEAAGLMAMLRQTDPEGYAAGCDALAVADCRASAALITAPTTVAVGTLDLATPPSAAAILAEAIAGARLERIEGAAHIPLFSHATTVNGILETALSRAD